MQIFWSILFKYFDGLYPILEHNNLEKNFSNLEFSKKKSQK